VVVEFETIRCDAADVANRVQVEQAVAERVKGCPRSAIRNDVEWVVTVWRSLLSSKDPRVAGLTYQQKIANFVLAACQSRRTGTNAGWSPDWAKASDYQRFTVIFAALMLAQPQELAETVEAVRLFVAWRDREFG
jgi:hypothetical protein